MDRNLKNDKESIKRILHKTLEESIHFIDNISDRPVGPYPDQPEGFDLPYEGMGAEKALNLLMSRYSKGFTASAGPRYFGFVTGGATPAAIVGDWLTSIFDQNVTGSIDSAAPYIEKETIRFFRQLFNLSDAYSGTFVTGATMANFVGLALARQWVAHQQNIDLAQQGLYGMSPIRIFSATPHSSIYKALSMLGMGRNSLEVIPTLYEREAINTAILAKKLNSFKQTPCVVVANFGTVNSGDFDNLVEIAKLKQEHKFWLHVDAAFGAFASCSPKYSDLVNGLNFADSITVDAHKWLNVPYDSAMQFTRHKDLQIQVFQNHASYLNSFSEEIDFVHLTPENSRRFRSLPAWLTLMAYGKKGYQEIVERNCELASILASRISESRDFKLLAPPRLNIVCFTLKLDQEKISSEEISQFLKISREDGNVFLTPTVYKGTPAIRAALSNWQTSHLDIEIAWKAICKAMVEFKELKK